MSDGEEIEVEEDNSGEEDQSLASDNEESDSEFDDPEGYADNISDEGMNER